MIYPRRGAAAAGRGPFRVVVHNFPLPALAHVGRGPGPSLSFPDLGVNTGRFLLDSIPLP